MTYAWARPGGGFFKLHIDSIRYQIVILSLSTGPTYFIS